MSAATRSREQTTGQWDESVLPPCLYRTEMRGVSSTARRRPRGRPAVEESQGYNGAMPTLGFFLRGIAALIALFLVTLFMDTTPAVNAVRALIAVGLAIVGLKMGLWYRGIEWPRRRRP